ncbi:MAG: hypothetical protein L6282_01820 [Candidatus Methanoperedenaceae archaeon]|nr:hypothetical protein [Candidatus Methanoperedenaceae archaeon]
MNNYDGLLPEISDENDGDIIRDFTCEPGNKRNERTHTMKLGDALQLCMGVNDWDQKLIGQKINTEYQPGFMADIEKARKER